MSRNEQVRVATQKKWAAMAERAKKISEKHTRTCAYFVVRCGMILMESLTWVCRACFCPKQTWLHYVHEFWFILTEHQWINATHGCECVCALHVCAHCILKRWQKKMMRSNVQCYTNVKVDIWCFFAVVVLVDVDVKIFISRWMREYGSNQCIAIFGASLCSSILLADFAMRAKLSRHKFERVTWHRSHETAIVLALIQSLHCKHTHWCWMLMFIRFFFIYKVPSVIIASVSLSPTNRLWHQFSHSIYVEALI